MIFDLLNRVCDVITVQQSQKFQIDFQSLQKPLNRVADISVYRTVF